MSEYTARFVSVARSFAGFSSGDEILKGFVILAGEYLEMGHERAIVLMDAGGDPSTIYSCEALLFAPLIECFAGLDIA